MAHLALPLAAAGDPGDIHVHDPMMIRQGHTYYVFSTGGGLGVRTSTDGMKSWSYQGTVFTAIPSWVSDAVGPLTDLWAPDVSFFGGLYHLYYAGSQFGTNTSVIGQATTPTLDPTSPRYAWTDRGLVLGTTSADTYNAIDPSVAFDAAHHPWLVFGSFWSGIKVRRLDARTGMLSRADTRLYDMAYRPESNAVEAPYIVHRGRYYYLFVSFGACCRGTASTYRIMVGRSLRITGPYTDRRGAPMMEGAATPVLAGSGRYRGPGGQSVLVDGSSYWLVYHYYDAADGGTAKLGIRTLLWTGDGWPRPGPLLITP
ncbi:MAG: arabinan endo-1,5-alpha-L-arabinosidase [Chloroflexota bacterium]